MKLSFFDRFANRIISRSQKVDYEEFTFENFGAADLIVVTTNLNKELKRIEESEAIQSVLAFVQRHQSGWHVPLDGVPVALKRLNFYDEGKIIGNIGVDLRFFTTHKIGSFWSKETDREEYWKLMELIGLEERVTR